MAAVLASQNGSCHRCFVVVVCADAIVEVGCRCSLSSKLSAIFVEWLGQSSLLVSIMSILHEFRGEVYSLSSGCCLRHLSSRPSAAIHSKSCLVPSGAVGLFLVVSIAGFV